MIVLDDVTKTFAGGERPAVGGLSLEVPTGEIVMLVGPSGCGKTTTLRMINRLIEPTSGAILLDGVDVTKQDPVEVRRGIGYVIQRVGLFPHRTIAENMATVPDLLGWARERIEERVEELTELVELDPEMLERYPHELSGGQRQRVGVARALAADPPVLLMDEPFGAVDPIVRGRLQDELRRLQERLQKTIVFVTHDVDEAIKLGDRVAVLNVGGVLEQYCPPEELLSEPANAFVEDFLGGERGLKRLSLRTVGELELEVATTAQAGSSGAAVKERMRAQGLEWITIVDEGLLVGWLEAKDIGDQVPTEARPFAAHTTIDTTLRQALDAVISSRTGVAVVVDAEERLVGMIGAEHLAEQLTR